MTDNLWQEPWAFDATRLRSLLLCDRRFWLEHQQQLRPAGRERSIDLDFGTAWHETARAYDSARVAGDNQPLLPAMKRALELSADWAPEWVTSAKNRDTLLRAIVWYDAQFGADNPLLPMVLRDGRPALELGFNFPLFDGRDRPTLCGNLDGVVQFGGETWILERKTTGSALSGFYWSGYDPNIQVDVYCLAAHCLWPEWNVQGVMIEAMQTGVGFTRFERKQFRRSRGRLAETLAVIQDVVSKFDAATSEIRPNPAACNVGAGCPFRAYCQSDPSMRQWVLQTQFAPRKDPWNPLAAR